MRYAMPPEQHAAIFGTPEPAGTGRAKLCKCCGGWHARGQVPHNCRPERRAMQSLASPQLAPRFDAFMTGVINNPAYISDRKAKREYMARNDLAEYDEGVSNDETWVEAIEAERQYVADFNAVCEMDPLVRKQYHPVPISEAGEGAGDIDVSDIEVIK